MFSELSKSLLSLYFLTFWGNWTVSSILKAWKAALKIPINYVLQVFSTSCFFSFCGNWRLQIRFQSIMFSKYLLVSLISLHLFTFWGNWRPQYEAVLHFLLPKPQSQSGPLLLNIKSKDFFVLQIFIFLKIQSQSGPHPLIIIIKYEYLNCKTKIDISFCILFFQNVSKFTALSSDYHKELVWWWLMF